MNRLPQYMQSRIVAALVQGTTGRGAAEILDLNKRTIQRNQVWIGEACQRFHDATVRHLNCTELQADEAWSFIWAKDKNLPESLRNRDDFGTMWTWIAKCVRSRLLVAWRVGKHTFADCQEFAYDIAFRIPGRIQITTDQLMHYRGAFTEAFGDRLDYATITKDMDPVTKTEDGKYEQPVLRGNRRVSVFGKPDVEQITTTTIESHNMQLRHYNRRYARSTIAFSRRLRNKRAALSMFSTYFNFCRIVPAIRVTPAMEAGLTDHIWKIEELIERINVEESRKKAVPREPTTPTPL